MTNLQRTQAEGIFSRLWLRLWSPQSRTLNLGGLRMTDTRIASLIVAERQRDAEDGVA